MTLDSTMSDSTPGSSPVREMKELLAEVTLKILRGAMFQAAASSPTPQWMWQIALCPDLVVRRGGDQVPEVWPMSLLLLTIHLSVSNGNLHLKFMICF